MTIARMVFGMAIALCTVTHVAAFAEEPAIDRLRACASESEDARRLACYDREMGRPERAADEDIGMNPDLRRQKEKEVGAAPKERSMTATVARVSEREYGKLLVMLDNGQVWAQTEARLFPLEAGNVVTVRPGALGSWWMMGPNGNVRTRVKRIK
jgi:hypothetical protein